MKFLRRHWPLPVGVVLIAWGVWAWAQAPVTTARLSWLAVTQDTLGGAISGATYNVYQGVRGSPAKAKVKTGLTALTITLPVTSAADACFNVSAQTPALGEGALSNEGCKSGETGVSVLTVQ